MLILGHYVLIHNETIKHDVGLIKTVSLKRDGFNKVHGMFLKEY